MAEGNLQLREAIGRLDERVLATADSLDQMHQALHQEPSLSNNVAQQLANLAQEIGSMRQEMGSMRQDMSSMQQDMSSMRQEITTLNKRLAVVEVTTRATNHTVVKSYNRELTINEPLMWPVNAQGNLPDVPPGITAADILNSV